jgi:hypothetical protein
VTVPIEDVAIHEAGHAVVGVVVGLPVSLVAIDTGTYPNRRHGVCVSGSEPVNVAREWVEQDTTNLVERPEPWRGGRLDEYLVFLLAGAVAVAHARGVPYAAIQPDGYHDRFVAEWLAADCAQRPPGAWVHALLLVIEGSARRHVREHWRWIQRVQGALLVDKVLTGDQVRALRPRRGRAV